MTLQRLLSYTRKAVDEYSLINEGDKIAIGISGGKDSLALLYALSGLRRFYPKSFEICAITVHLGIKEMDFTEVAKLCEELDVPYYIVETDINDIVFNIRKEPNPCALCAKLRKGALNTKALELGCNKIAYAHHRDDFNETFMMSLIYEGRINTFSPMTYLDQTGLTLIRPLLFVPEAEIIGFKNKYNLPVVKNFCPADGVTKREETKQLVASINSETPGFHERLFGAILRGDIKGWPPRDESANIRNKKKLTK